MADANRNGIEDSMEAVAGIPGFGGATGLANSGMQPTATQRSLIDQYLTPIDLRGDFAAQRRAVSESLRPLEREQAARRQAFERYAYMLGLSQQEANRLIQQGYGTAQQNIAAQAGSVAGAANRGAASLADIYGNVGAQSAALGAGQGLSAQAGQTGGLAGPGAVMAGAPNVTRATGDVAGANVQTMGRYGAESLGSAATAAQRAGTAAASGIDQWLNNLTAGQRLQYDLQAAETRTQLEAERQQRLAEIAAAESQAVRGEELASALLRGSIADDRTWNDVKGRAKKLGLESREDVYAAMQTYGSANVAALLGLTGVLTGMLGAQ